MRKYYLPLFMLFLIQINAFSEELVPVNYILTNEFNQYTGIMNIKNRNGKISQCTATYISSNVAITAKHCIEDVDVSSLPNNKSYLKRAQIKPGKFEDVAAITYFTAIGKKDIALITLYPPLETTGLEFPKIIPMTQKKLNAKKIIISGYPGDKNEQLFTGQGNIFNFRNDFYQIIRHDVPTSPGVSGAAIRELYNDFDIVSIHTNRNNWGKHGYLFSEQDIEIISNFIYNEEISPIKNFSHIDFPTNYIKGQQSQND